MHASFRTCLPFALLAMAACSPKPAPQSDAAPVTTPASVAIPAPANVAVAQEGERKCTNEPRTDENDKRPRCGGMGTPKAGKPGYRIDIAGIGRNTSGGACVVKPTVACDVSKPFSSEFCGGTLTHTPTSDKGGTFEMHVSGGGGSFTQSGSYTLSGPEEQMTATYASTKLCAQGGGMTFCLPPRTLSTTWTKVDDCGQ